MTIQRVEQKWNIITAAYCLQKQHIHNEERNDHTYNIKGGLSFYKGQWRMIIICQSGHFTYASMMHLMDVLWKEGKTKQHYYCLWPKTETKSCALTWMTWKQIVEEDSVQKQCNVSRRDGKSPRRGIEKINDTARHHTFIWDNDRKSLCRYLARTIIQCLRRNVRWANVLIIIALVPILLRMKVKMKW